MNLGEYVVMQDGTIVEVIAEIESNDYTTYYLTFYGFGFDVKQFIEEMGIKTEDIVLVSENDYGTKITTRKC